MTYTRGRGRNSGKSVPWYIYYYWTASVTIGNVCRVNDMRHGLGECVYVNGDKYKGEFVGNLRHGIGVYTAGFSLSFSIYKHTHTYTHTHTHTLGAWRVRARVLNRHTETHRRTQGGS